MSQTIFDDLEEGEIADDIPEPVVEKKDKPLPRRYVINDKKLKSRHKKRNHKHNSDHHKFNKSNFNSHSDSKLHKKTCPKHNSLKHFKSPHSSRSNFKRDEFFDVSLNHRESKHAHQKLPTLKSAFKNYKSPPRKVSKVNDSKVKVPVTSELSCRYSPLLSGYKKSQNEVNNKFKNISNLKNQCISVNANIASKTSGEKTDNLISKQRSSENLPPIEVVVLDESDDDVEELRRIALATCSKRPTTLPGVSSEVGSVEAADNYEVVDMDVDNEPENLNKEDDLFVIDTTPSYICGVNRIPPSCPLDLNLNINHGTNGIVNGFLPAINIEGTYPNFGSDIFNQNLNNDLYTNFETEVKNSRLPTSHLDEEFEEDILRAELIASMTSSRESNKNTLPREEKVSGQNAVLENRFESECTRIVRFKPDSCINNNERVVSIESEVAKKDTVFKEERTVSIVKDVVVTEDQFKNKSVIVSSFANTNSLGVANSPLRNGVDIKVKVNNVPSMSISSQNIVSVPNERIIISLNNETSSDESDDETYQTKQPAAMASLEALISNARQESDGKKPPPPTVNGATNALSCLSKAQQEEYNSLIKILAKSKEAPAQNSQEEIKNIPENKNVVLLKKKLLIAKQNYEKEKALMNTNMRDLMKKKRAYMAAKTKTQELKDQMNAAEKLRKANLQLWTNSAHQLATLRKSLSKRQALINTLQTKINTMVTETFTNGLSPMSCNTPDQDTAHNS